jgi:uncharacterized protein YgiM (DUF1202 family)
MERPGLLEFVVYALVLTAAAGWVYALPPFTHEPGKRSQSAEIQSRTAASSGSTDAAGSDRSATVTEVGSQDSAAAEQPSATEIRSATASEPDEQPRLDSRPNLLVVTATSLNMRSEPNAGSALVGSYPRGARVERIETSGNWVLVRTIDDDTTGWMYASYLGPADGN